MKKSLAVLFVLLLAVMPLLASANTETMYVKTGDGKGLNMRTAPVVAEENKVGSIAYGTKVEVIQYVNSYWALVQPDGWSNPYYCQRRFLVSNNPGKYTPSKEETTTVVNEYANFVHVNAFEATVTTGRAGGFANLRWAPSKTAALMEKIYPGATVKVIATNGEWYQVIDETNDYVGFLYKTFLNV